MLKNYVHMHKSQFLKAASCTLSQELLGFISCLSGLLSHSNELKKSPITKCRKEAQFLPAIIFCK